jgi:hypothetical protein
MFPRNRIGEECLAANQVFHFWRNDKRLDPCFASIDTATVPVVGMQLMQQNAARRGSEPDRNRARQQWRHAACSRARELSCL